jgi:hypothetical protein
LPIRGWTAPRPQIRTSLCFRNNFENLISFQSALSDSSDRAFSFWWIVCSLGTP